MLKRDEVKYVKRKEERRRRQICRAETLPELKPKTAERANMYKIIYILCKSAGCLKDDFIIYYVRKFTVIVAVAAAAQRTRVDTCVASSSSSLSKRQIMSLLYAHCLGRACSLKLDRR